MEENYTEETYAEEDRALSDSDMEIKELKLKRAEMIEAFKEASAEHFNKMFEAYPREMTEFCIGKRILKCRVENDNLVMETEMVEKSNVTIYKPFGYESV